MSLTVLITKIMPRYYKARENRLSLSRTTYNIFDLQLLLLDTKEH